MIIIPSWQETKKQFMKNIRKQRVPVGYSDSQRGRFISDLPKYKVIKLIKQIIVNASTAWIKDRMSKTGNDSELELIKKHPNCLINTTNDYNKKCQEIIAIYNERGERIWQKV
jgi:hypothetical protein